MFLEDKTSLHFYLPHQGVSLRKSSISSKKIWSCYLKITDEAVGVTNADLFSLRNTPPYLQIVYYNRRFLLILRWTHFLGKPWKQKYYINYVVAE